MIIKGLIKEVIGIEKMNIILQPFIDNNLGDDLMIKLFAKNSSNIKLLFYPMILYLIQDLKKKKILFFTP